MIFTRTRFLPLPVELTVVDLLPGPEVELSARDGHDHFAPHDLPLQVGVTVVLARPVVAVAARSARGGPAPRASPGSRR